MTDTTSQSSAEEPSATTPEPSSLAPEASAGPLSTDASPGQSAAGTPGAGIRYATLRLLMLVTVAGMLYLVGMRGWGLAFTAVLVSGIASLFLLTRPREAAARNLEASVHDRSARRQQNKA